MSKIALAVLIPVLLVAVALPAQALWLHPQTYPLLNEDGKDSGCDLHIGGGQEVGSPDSGFLGGIDGYIRVHERMECESHWRAEKVLDGFQPVLDDGERGKLHCCGGAYSWYTDDQAPPDGPYVARVGAKYNPCLIYRNGGVPTQRRSQGRWLVPLGTRTLILYGYAKVNEYKSDLHPYQAIVEKPITVTCTKQRAPYR
jgi:hypothetical protein